MKYILSILIVLLPVTAMGGEHTIRRGTSTKIPLSIDHMKETMIVLPEHALGVTGVGKTEFQMEPVGDYIMLRSLKPDAHGNLFINFGGKTIVSLELSTIEGGGEQLVTLRYAPEPPAGIVSGSGRLSGDLNLRTLATPWEVTKLGSKSTGAGFSARTGYAVIIGDRVLVNFAVENNSSETLNISNTRLVRETLGGLKGTAVIDTVEIPSKCALDVKSLSPGDEAYGSLVFAKTYVDFDQKLVLKIHNNRLEGPELRIDL